MFVRLLLLLSIFCTSMLQAKSLQLESLPLTERIHLNEFTYLLPSSSQIDWPQIQSPSLHNQFRPLKNHISSILSDEQSPFWLYWSIELMSNDPQSVHIQFDHKFAQHLHLYQWQHKQLQSHSVNGSHLASADRASIIANYNFPVLLQPGINEFYLQVESTMPNDFKLHLVSNVKQERGFYIKALMTGLFMLTIIWLMGTQAWLVSRHDRAIALSSTAMMSALVLLLAANADVFSVIFLQSSALDRYIQYISSVLFTFVLLVHAFLYGKRWQFFTLVVAYIVLSLLVMGLLLMLSIVPVIWLVLSICALNLFISFVLLSKITNKSERSFYLYFFVLCSASFVLTMYFFVISHIFDYQGLVFWLGQSVITLIAGLIAFKLHSYYYERIKQENPSYQAVTDQHWPLLRKINHDLRGPINGVLGMSELMQTTALSENQKEYLNSVFNAGYDLLGQVDELQNLVRIGLNTLPMQTNKTDIHHFLQLIIEPYARMAQAKKIEVIINIAPNLPLTIILNQNLTMQVMRSLLDNALKYTPEGEIEIQVAVTPSEQIRFAVRNTGSFIEKEKIANLFEFTPIDQLNKKDVPRYGLPVAKVLVDRMGGQFNFEKSGQENDVVVFMDLPLNVVASKGSNNYENEQLTQLKVLIVDDNATCRKVLELQLANIGINADSASNGLNALAYMHKAFHKHKPYDVILLDHQMPGMTGIEVVKKIRKDKKLDQNVNIIMFSGADLTVNEGSLKEVSVFSVLNKPVSATVLKRQLLKLKARQSNLKEI